MALDPIRVGNHATLGLLLPVVVIVAIDCPASLMLLLASSSIPSCLLWGIRVDPTIDESKPCSRSALPLPEKQYAATLASAIWHGHAAVNQPSPSVAFLIASCYLRLASEDPASRSMRFSSSPLDMKKWSKH